MERKTFNILGLGLTAMAVGTIAAQQLVAFLAARFAPAMYSAWWFPMSCTALLYIVGVPLFWLVTRRLPKGPAPERHTFGPGTVTVLYFICMGGMYIFNFAGIAFTQLLSLLLGRAVNNPLTSALEGSSFVLTLVIAGILSPFFEELAFRKILLDPLRPFGDRTAMIFSALMFGLFHMNFSQFFYAFAIGLVLAYAALKTGDIRVSVLLHILVNLMGAVLMPALTASGSPAALPLAVSFMLLCMVLSIVFLCVFHGKISLSPPRCRFSEPVTGGMIYANPGVLIYYLFIAAMFVLNTLLA